MGSQEAGSQLKLKIKMLFRVCSDFDASPWLVYREWGVQKVLGELRGHRHTDPVLYKLHRLSMPSLSVPPSTSMKVAAFTLSLVAVALGQSQEMVEMMEGVDTYNWRTKCWGESNVDSYILQSEGAKRECMQMEPTIDTPEFGLPTNPFSPLTNNPFTKLQSGGDVSELKSLWRSKRAVEGILKPDNEDLYDFLQNVADHREMKRNKMSNLTCVLQKMTMLTEDMEVNMEFYTTALTGETDPELGLAFDDEESVAIDPEWRQKMSDSYQDCFDLSQNFPQSAIGRQPFRRIFGRRMIFFRCAAVSDLLLLLCKYSKLFP